MRTYISVLLCCCYLLSVQAQKEQNLTFEQSDSILLELYLNTNLEKALPFALSCVELSKSLTDSIHLVSLYNLTQVYYGLGRFENALEILKKRVAFSEKRFGKKHTEYVESLSQLAGCYVYLVQLDTALEIVSKEMALRKELFGSQSPKFAKSLIAIASITSHIGNYEEAESYLLEALNIYKKHPTPSDEEDAEYYSLLLNNLGLLYLRLNRYQEAESYLKESYNLYVSSYGEDDPRNTAPLNNLAMIYGEMDRVQESIDMYKKCLDIVIKAYGSIHLETAVAYNNLASMLSKSKKNEEAEKMYKMAIQIWKKELGSKHIYYASSIFGLGEHYGMTKRYEEGKKLIEEAAGIILEQLGEHHENYIQCLNNLAVIERDNSNYEASKAYLYKAIQFNLKNGDQNSILHKEKLSSIQFYHSSYAIKSLHIQHELYQKKYRSSLDKNFLDSSYLALCSAIGICQNYRNSFHSESDKYRILSDLNTLVAKIIKTGLLSDNKKPDPELFSYAELNKSALLSDVTKSKKARSFGDLPDSLAVKEWALSIESDNLKKQESELTTTEVQKTLLEKRNNLTVEINSFKKRIEKDFPKYFKLKYINTTATVDEIQRLLPKNTLLLEYFQSDSVLYLFTITTSSYTLHPLAIDKSFLKVKIDQLRKSLSNYDFIKNEEDNAYQLYTKSAYWFYQNLLVPALTGLEGIENLVLVADGELGHLPFEAFLTAEVTEKKAYSELPYLLNKYNVSYNYSATLWKENLEQKEGKHNGKMLAVAASYQGKSANSGSNSYNARAPHLRNLRDALNDLPAARQEVAGLSKLFTGDFWQENSSNERSFKAKVEHYAIVHLAMHGLLNERAPILSSLAFTENGDSTEDNFLEAWEISHLKLNAELVVLSACETGYGKFQQGEGVMSLARSFMYAGVPSLVVSMWQVNDASTSVIMQTFYKNLAKGMDKAEALRQAKLEYIGSVDGIAAHPAFWAPFVQLGDSRPIRVGTIHEFGLQGWVWWIGGGIGLLVLSAGIFIARRKKSQ